MNEHNTRDDDGNKRTSPRFVHENLSISYVSLAALVRYL
jgi:hypothetical protein